MWDDMACMGTWIPWMQWVFGARSGRAAERLPDAKINDGKENTSPSISHMIHGAGIIC